MCIDGWPIDMYIPGMQFYDGFLSLLCWCFHALTGTFWQHAADVYVAGEECMMFIVFAAH